MILLVLVMASAAMGAPALFLSEASAATTRKATKKSARKSKKPKKRIPKAPPIDTRNLALPDDPKLPLETAWKAQISRFLGRERPEYAAFVALHPASGRVLVISDRSVTPKTVAHPATSAMFPAASIFKMVTAAALIEEAGVPASTVTCYHGGGSRLAEEHIRDNRKRDTSCRSLTESFAHSTNAVFAKLALKHLGAQKLLKWGERLGFNQDISWEGHNVRSVLERPVGDLTIGRTAAGFTNSSLAPLHAAMIAMVFANHGLIPAAFAAWFPGSTLIESTDAPAVHRVLSESTVDALRGMMVLAATGGTAQRHLGSVTGGPAAVKTGTLSSRDGSGHLNTWMVGYYPATNPEFAFAAVVATKGRVRAGHLTRFAIESFVHLSRARRRQP